GSWRGAAAGGRPPAAAHPTPPPGLSFSNTPPAVADRLSSRADGSAPPALWVSDGTPGGTTRLTNIIPDAPSVASGSYLFFSISNRFTSLYRSDGTPEGTILLKDFGPADPFGNSGPAELTDVNGTLFSTATGGPDVGRQLWKSDGTPEGTVPVKKIITEFPFIDDFLFELTNAGGTLFFTALDFTVGAELYKSDGTAEGTVLVKDITPG